MKIAEKKQQISFPKLILTYDPNLDVLGEIDLFPKKTARAKERFKTLKLPVR